MMITIFNDNISAYTLQSFQTIQRDLALFLVKQGTMKLSNFKMCDVK